MLSANLVEYFACRSRAAVGHIVKSLPDGLENIRTCGDIQQAVICLGILHYSSSSLSLHCKGYGTFAPLKLFHKVASVETWSAIEYHA
jgi:hypothetical protein